MMHEAHRRLSEGCCVLTANFLPLMRLRGVEMLCVRGAGGISASSSRLIGESVERQRRQ